VCSSDLMIMALLEDLHRTHRLTSVYVTHNSAFAERADRILRLEKGLLEVSATGGTASPEGVPEPPQREGRNYV